MGDSHSLTNEQMVENKKKQIIQLMESKGFVLINSRGVFPKVDDVQYYFNVNKNTSSYLVFRFPECGEDVE